MSNRDEYIPGPAAGAEVRKDGENWTLVLVRQLRHSPEKVWRALTDPAQLREWAPFDADGNMGIAGSTVKLNTVGTPTPLISETSIKRADEPNVLEYRWGDGDLRWELEDFDGGTRLTLWHNIDRRHIHGRRRLAYLSGRSGSRAQRHPTRPERRSAGHEV
jgi:uncharacterized protein YndB with AHSA1/START domain